MSDLRNVGLSLPDRDVDQLDELAENRDPEVSHVVTRSHIGREVIPIGIDALRIIEQREDARRLALAEKRALVRQALSVHEPEMWDETDALVDALADAEDVDADDLRDAILRIKLDE